MHKPSVNSGTADAKAIVPMVVSGIAVNDRTQCAHYHSERDVAAVRFKCCDAFYACIHCHEELADHIPVVWGQNERDVRAILCGCCHNTLSITEYLNCQSRCPLCGAAFNPACSGHFRFYFE